MVISFLVLLAYCLWMLFIRTGAQKFKGAAFAFFSNRVGGADYCRAEFEVLGAKVLGEKVPLLSIYCTAKSDAKSINLY